MKLEEGIYVRTKQGYIAKFKEYDEIFDVLRFETPIFLRSWMPCDYMQKERFMNRYFLKASHNIIDLIEVGDVITTNNLCGEVTHIEGDKIYTTCYDGEYCYDYQIQSIVTKEQMESMKYEVK